MCGICGVIGVESTDRSAAILRRMLTAIVHRGPDEEGSRVAPRLAAGTRRLSIIDLATGSQPIWNENETLAVFYNGEIYNFRQLRDELIAAGHHFRTNSDTEVIVHAYEAWGAGGFSRFNGMFAFAIAEMPQGKAGPVARVVLARDRYGIKPLYYSAHDGALFFASEVRALLASGCLPAQLSADAVSSYLLFGSTVEPCTLVEGVYSLPPGHFAAVRADSQPLGLESKPFWRPGFAKASGKSPASTNSEPVPARIRLLLEAAVRRHLIADVPVGVFLSSGLDSTAIAALAARAQGGIHTFTVSFPDLEFSEAELARKTAARLGATHSELQLSGDAMVARLDEAIEALDQPSMDGINTYFVSWAARQGGLKVALSGLGSDEIFGGYPTFQTTESVARLGAIAHMTPGAVRSLIASAARTFSPARAATPAFEKALGPWLRPDALPNPYYFTRTLFPPQVAAEATAAKNGWLGSLWWKWLRQCAEETRTVDDFTAVSWLELRGYMLNTLLRDTDSMSMGNSLEVRVPFLDAALVDGVLALPESAKRVPGAPKSLLIAALGDLLPPEILGQRKKTFTFPWERWLRGSLGHRVAAGLADWSSALAPVLSQQFALSVWDNFKRGRTTWSRPWSLYVLNQWAKQHLAAAGPSASDRARRTQTVNASH
jgi:asparagine synthase (glutamine-hydrolysing)